MPITQNKKFNPIGLIIVAVFFAFSIHTIVGVISIFIIIFFFTKYRKFITSYFVNYSQAVKTAPDQAAASGGPVVGQMAIG
ncbi:MAG: hypothetical protein WCT27_05270, partial [Patescibacteria group bacterium]